MCRTGKPDRVPNHGKTADVYEAVRQELDFDPLSAATQRPSRSRNSHRSWPRYATWSSPRYAWPPVRYTDTPWRQLVRTQAARMLAVDFHVD